MGFFNDVFFLLPELYWIFITIGVLLLGVSVVDTVQKILVKHIGLLVAYLLCLYAYISAYLPDTYYSLLNYQYSADSFSYVFKLFIILFLMVITYLSTNYLFVERVFFFEYYFLISLFCVSAFFLISVTDLVLFYLVIELQALVLYTLASLKRYNVFSAEAGLKYFVLGAFSSGLLLFGISFFYGFTGVTNFYDLKYLLLSTVDGAVYNGLNLAFTFLLVAFLFKLAAAPFHLWAPDVYSGSPTIVVTLFATLPKIAVFLFLMRFYGLMVLEVSELWYKFFFFSGLLSVIWGTVAALNQFNIKRLYAYSAIVNIGNLLVVFAYGSLSNFAVVLNYVTVYTISTLALFLVILTFRRNDGARKFLFIADYSMLYTHSGLLAAIIAIIFFSLAGVPPLAGFFIKFFLFRGVFMLDFLANFALFVVLLASVISAFYYIRVIRFAFFTSERIPALFAQVDSVMVFLLVVLILFLLFFVFLQPVLLLTCTYLVSALFI